MEGKKSNEIMKILQVITRTDAGGAQMVLALLANAQVQQGYDVTVVSGPGDGTLLKWLDKGVKFVKCSSLQRALSFGKDIHAYKELRAIYKQLQPDIVHLHCSKVGTLGRLAFPKRKTVYTVHGFEGVEFFLYKPIEWFLQFRCAALVGVCEQDIKDMAKANITRNVHYIFNGIRPQEKKELSWPVPDSYQKSILCVARLSAQKNHKLFFEVARLLPEYAFVWIGNAEPVLEPYPENVFFLGTIPSASQYCQLCDLFILPSNYEGLPMTVIEAMSYGKPVVASNVGGVAEIVRTDVNGYALSNDSHLFVQKISYILENADVYKKMSINSKEIFEKELSSEIMANKYIELYHQISICE